MSPDRAWIVIQRMADDLEPVMKRAYLDAVERLRRFIDLVRLADAIERGDIGVVNLELTSASIQREFAEAAETLRRLTLEVMRFENLRLGPMANPHAVLIANRQAARFVTRVGEETRTAIRAAIVEGVRGGASPAQVAKQIQVVVGLTERQTRAVENLRRKGATEAQVARYAKKLLKQRATTIARTETIAAANAGQQAAWQDAQRQGLLPRDIKRTWITTKDDRLCDHCRAVGGQVVGIDEPFRTPLGAVMNPPLHPNCRCAIALDVASLAEARRVKPAA